MPSLKAIRKRISSVQSTQKITRAMKMVAGARLNRAQTRILELRPYAVKTQEVLAGITVEPVNTGGTPVPPAKASDSLALAPEPALPEAADATATADAGWADKPAHPLLVGRPERRVLIVVLTSDRGLCGAFNTNINKRAEREWRERAAAGQEPKLVIIGRKGRDYMNRRGAPILEYLPGIWDKLGLETAQQVGKAILAPFNRKEVDAIYLVYNEFKSAMTQRVVVERLLPVARPDTPFGGTSGGTSDEADKVGAPTGRDGGYPQTPGDADFLFEPNKTALLDRLVPMYVDISILRALYESQASEFGARMTAMDAATKNAKEMISALTLQYNKARQAAITKELMEIIGGSEALKE